MWVLLQFLIIQKTRQMTAIIPLVWIWLHESHVMIQTARDFWYTYYFIIFVIFQLICGRITEPDHQAAVNSFRGRIRALIFASWRPGLKVSKSQKQFLKSSIFKIWPETFEGFLPWSAKGRNPSNFSGQILENWGFQKLLSRFTDL